MSVPHKKTLLALILSVWLVGCADKGQQQTKNLDACYSLVKTAAITGHRLATLGYSEDETLIELEKIINAGAN